MVIATDGSASAIRTEMMHLPRFNFSQRYLDYGYKELTIPAGPEGKHLLEPLCAAHLASRILHVDCAAQH